MAAKPKTTRSTPTYIAGLLRAGCSPRPLSLRLRGRAPATSLRRHRPLAHTRGALLAHVHHTNRPYPRPAIGTTIADQAHRDGGAERWAAPAVHTSMEGALALLPSDDARLRDVALPIVNTATHQDAPTLYRLHTVPGIGQDPPSRAALRHAGERALPRGQDCAASGRLVTWAKHRRETFWQPPGSPSAMRLSRGFSPSRRFYASRSSAEGKCLASLEKKT